MTIHVVGGVYYEYCARPQWDCLFGSAGRAAVALASMGNDVRLHSYFTEHSLRQFRGDFAWYEKLEVDPTMIGEAIRFRYLHDLARPTFNVPQVKAPSLTVNEDCVVRFGVLEGDAVVSARYAVYDPQNMGVAEPFSANGSRAEHLALVLNYYEAQIMAGEFGMPPLDCAQRIASSQAAEIVVVKMGPLGALVWADGQASTVPAFRTGNVWKIGSGDSFVAYFAHGWMNVGLTAHVAAELASKATALYCDSKILPNEQQLATFIFPPVEVSAAFRAGKKPKVYLAGPFFDLAQVWMVEEVRRNLHEAGLQVFSPYHDVGLGGAADVVDLDLKAIENCDLVFAIADGLDAGTIYEIGFARAKGKPVVVYSERESDESLKMAEGSNCHISRNYTTALYTALWEAAKL